MRYGKSWVITVLAFILLLPTLITASPMKPELLEQLKLQKRLAAVVERQQQAREDGYFHIEQPRFARPLTGASTDDVDTVRVPVILATFTDHQYTSFSPAPEAAQYDSILFSWGKMPKGSMSEFYWENSYGTFYLTGDVVGWYLMPQTYAYYVDGNNGFNACPRCARQMVADAVNAADPDLDYSRYDSDGDGWVDGIFVVFAGYGAEESGNDNDIWSHRSSINTQFLDGVNISDYSVEPGVRSSASITDIGVFCHEFGHVLGLPDLYDTDYSSGGIGRWSLMSGGSWNGGGHTPAHFDAWCKAQLGFVEPVNILLNTNNVQIPRAEDNPVAYRLWTEGQLGPQYFLVENRQKVLFDVGIPGSGILIWHIDETRSGNSDENHPLVALEQADGLNQLASGGSGDGGDPWPGTSNNREFNDFSTPNGHAYSGALTEIGVYSISNSAPLMTADLEIVYGRPFLRQDAMNFNDYLGNGNGRADPGENDVELVLTYSNLGYEALGLTMLVSTIDPEIVFSDNQADFGDILGGQQGDNSADPIIFSVDPNFPPTIVNLELNFSANGGDWTKVETLTVDVGPPQIILVDDDEATHFEYEEYYLSYLQDSLRMPYTIWGKDTLSAPPADTLGDYPLALWFTGNSRSEVLSTADVANLRDFLDAGGRLFLTGQDIAQDLADDEDSTFLRDYLYVRYQSGSALQLAQGVDGDPIGDGQTVPLGGPGGASNQNSPDILVPVNAMAKTVYTYYGSANTAGVRVAAGGYKVVFFGFGCEAIANDLGYTTREEVFARVFAWLTAAPPEYIPGDLDGNQAVDPVDVVYEVNLVYRGGDPPPNGVNAADVDGSCATDPVDVVYLVNYVYRSLGQLVPGCVE